jgi:2-polyprenyl-6-methoxyphenol hydroxylase-like FAD-dependent oxidoreductase
VADSGRGTAGGTACLPVRVAIAGGGIGGMALALALHDAGFRDVDVYDSASRVQELGSGSTCSRMRHAN